MTLLNLDSQNKNLFQLVEISWPLDIITLVETQHMSNEHMDFSIYTFYFQITINNIINITSHLTSDITSEFILHRIPSSPIGYFSNYVTICNFLFIHVFFKLIFLSVEICSYFFDYQAKFFLLTCHEFYMNYVYFRKTRYVCNSNLFIYDLSFLRPTNHCYINFQLILFQPN